MSDHAFIQYDDFAGSRILVWDVPFNRADPTTLRKDLRDFKSGQLWDMCKTKQSLAGLKDAFEYAARDYVRMFGSKTVAETAEIVQEGYSVWMKTHGFTPPHAHFKGADFTAVYYVDSGDPSLNPSTLVNPLQGVPLVCGALVFMDTSPNWPKYFRDDQKRGYRGLHALTGRMVMFPPTLFHFSIPHEGMRERVFISNNLKLVMP